MAERHVRPCLSVDPDNHNAYCALSPRHEGDHACMLWSRDEGSQGVSYWK